MRQNQSTPPQVVLQGSASLYDSQRTARYLLTSTCMKLPCAETLTTRMVVPVAQFTIPYRAVYLLSLPYAPPREVFGQFNTQQQAELARLFLVMGFAEWVRSRLLVRVGVRLDQQLNGLVFDGSFASQLARPDPRAAPP